MSVLEIRDLQVSVKLPDGQRKPILAGVDLTVRAAETHAIMGPNGSGKSTLAYSIAGHPKYEITGGTVTLDGRTITYSNLEPLNDLIPVTNFTFTAPASLRLPTSLPTRQDA